MDLFLGAPKWYRWGETNLRYVSKVCRRKVDDHDREINSTTHTTFTTKLRKHFFKSHQQSQKGASDVKGRYSTKRIMEVSVSCLLNVRRGQ